MENKQTIENIIDNEVYSVVADINFDVVYYLLHTNRDLEYPIYINLINNSILHYDKSYSDIIIIIDLKGLENDTKTRIINTFGGIHGKNNTDGKRNVDKDNIILTIGLLKGMNRVLYEKNETKP